MDGVLFEFRDVTVANADGSSRVCGLTAVIPDHGVTVIAGPSGAGKSTALRLCNALEVPDSGSLSYRGEPIGSMDPLLLRRRVAMVFQRATALPGSVADNLRVGARNVTPGQISTVLDRVGLEGTEERDARELSGGETQRMAMARSLITEPEYLLFDEATTSLDPAATSKIEALALGLAEEGISSAWVTHDLDQMRRLAHHLIILVDGALAQQGDLDDVLSDPEPRVEDFLEGRFAEPERTAGSDPTGSDQRGSDPTDEGRDR